MIKAIVLSLTLLLITLVAAHVVQSQNLTDVKKPAEVPKPSISESQSPEEMPPQSSEPPRFVGEISLPTAPSTPVIPEINSVPEGVLSSVPADASASVSLPEESSAPVLDPSAAVHASPGEEPVSAPPPNTPTEAELKKIAAPFVKEIYAIKDKAFDSMALIEQKVTTEYLSTDPAERQQKLYQIANRYLPDVMLLIADTDEKVDAVVVKMTAALSAVGGSTAMAQDVAAAYNEEKNQKITYYTEMASRISKIQTPPVNNEDEGSGL